MKNKILEIQAHELDLLNIKIYEYDFKTCNAVTFFMDGFYHIGIKKGIPAGDKYWLLEHELDHIRSGKMYHVNDDKFIINQAEREVNNLMLEKSRLVIPIYNALKKGYSKEQICEMFDLPGDVFDCSMQYLKRRAVMNAYLRFLVGDK